MKGETNLTNLLKSNIQNDYGNSIVDLLLVGCPAVW